MICSVFSFLFDILVPLSFVRNHTSFRASIGAQVTGGFTRQLPTLNTPWRHPQLPVAEADVDVGSEYRPTNHPRLLAGTKGNRNIDAIGRLRTPYHLSLLDRDDICK